MVFKNEDDKVKVVIGTCNCGCNSELHITHYKEEGMDDEFYLSLHSSKWDEEQVGLFQIIGRRIKRAWYNLIGKDYLYMDIIFNKEEFDQFTKNIVNLNKTAKK